MAESAEGQGTEAQVASGEQGGEQGQEGEGGPSLEALQGRMEETEAKFLEKLDQIGERLPQQQEPAPEEYGQVPGYEPGQFQPFDPQQDPAAMAQGYYGPDGQPDPYAAAAMMQQGLQQQGQQMSQLAQELQQMRVEHGAERLQEQYPDLQDGEHAQKLLRDAEQWAQEVGQPDIARTPAVLEMVYLAGQAREQAKAEESAEDEVATQVEGAAGANPGEPETPPSQRIVEAGRSNVPGAGLWGF